MDKRRKLIRAITRYARAVPGAIGMREFCKAARTTEGAVCREFPKGLPDLLAVAGLNARASRHERVPYATLMEEYARVARLIGGEPRRLDIERHARISFPTFVYRLGPLANIQREHRLWSALRHPTAPAKPTPPSNLGRPLSPVALLQSPTCESGVIYLFGLLARDLGFVVEEIRTSFPDCTALREADDGRWRRIAIEFEFKSTNFRSHRHDPDRCDLLICWDHDWTKCPLEVLDLKRAVEHRLQSPPSPTPPRRRN